MVSRCRSRRAGARFPSTGRILPAEVPLSKTYGTPRSDSLLTGRFLLRGPAGRRSVRRLVVKSMPMFPRAGHVTPEPLVEPEPPRPPPPSRSTGFNSPEIRSVDLDTSALHSVCCTWTKITFLPLKVFASFFRDFHVHLHIHDLMIRRISISFMVL